MEGGIAPLNPASRQSQHITIYQFRHMETQILMQYLSFLFVCLILRRRYRGSAENRSVWGNWILVSWFKGKTSGQDIWTLKQRPLSSKARLFSGEFHNMKKVAHVFHIMKIKTNRQVFFDNKCISC